MADNPLTTQTSVDALDVWWAEILPFKPCIIYNEPLHLTEMIMEDVATVWHQWGPFKGHAVDCGYAMDDGRLVGIKIWDDVRSRPERMICDDS